MITPKDLEGLVLISHLSDEMIKKLIPHMNLLKYDEQEYVFRQGDPSEYFYFLKRGKVLLEKRLSDKVTVVFGAVKPSYSFGWSSMLGSPYSTEAVCSEPSEIISLDSLAAFMLMEEDHALGFYFSQALMRVIQKRLEIRTDQFVRSIANHPECAVLLD